MGENAVNESVTIPIDEEAAQEEKGNDTFPMAIRELGEAIFQNYDEKTSNLSDENILGIIRCNALNDFMSERYGVRFTVLDELVTNKMALVISHNGYGIEKFIELTKSIQASFTQTEIPATIAQRLMNRR
jgi:hypothetical protein